MSKNLLSESYDLVTAFDVLYHITDDDKFRAAIKNISHALKPGGFLFLTDVLSSRNIISFQKHVRWRSLTTWKQELENNMVTIVSLAPVYTFLQSPVDATGPFARILNMFYYRITSRLTSKSACTPVAIEKAYLSILYNIDSITTLFPRFGVSIKLLVAKKRG